MNPIPTTRPAATPGGCDRISGKVPRFSRGENGTVPFRNGEVILSRVLATRRPPGYTLVELLVAVTVSGILAAGMVSTLYVASRAANTGGPTRAMLSASAATDDVLSELHYALTFTERSANAVEFTVADRNGDGAAETIRYAWSGTPGDPLTRRYNGGSAVEVLKDMHHFELSYSLPNENVEQVLAGWQGSTSLSDQPISSTQWRGQYFKPSLPPDADSWGVTRARIKLRRQDAPNGEALIQLRPATSSKTPSSVVLEEVSLMENVLSGTYQWKEIYYHNVSGLSPGLGLCLVVQHVYDTYSCTVEYQSGGVTQPEGGLLESGDQGASWTNTPDKALQFYVYGTYRPGPPSFVGISLQVGENTTSRVTSGIEILNLSRMSTP